MSTLQAVLISTDIDPENAIKEAKKYIKNKRKYTTTSSFYRFTNIPKNKFNLKTLKIKDIDDDVKLIIGDLKEEFKELKGSGIMDFLKNPIGTIKEAFSGIPTKLNNVSQRTLQENGKKPIILLKLAKTPLNQQLSNVVNIISLGKMQEVANKYGYDKMFHISLIATLPNNNNIIIEKNETVTIEPLQNSKSINDKTEYLNVAVMDPILNLNEMINKTIQYMGESSFYSYDAFDNNCEKFVKSILRANNLYNNRIDDFINQDTINIKKDLNESGFSYVPKTIRKITDFASIVSRLVGKGTQKEALDHYEKYLKKNNIDDELIDLTDKFIDFINCEGIKFI